MTAAARLAEMLADRNRDSSAAVRDELIELLLFHAHEAEHALNDILTLRQIYLGEVEVNLEEVNLRDQIEASFRDGEREYRLRLTVSGDLDVRADPRLVSRIISNLFRNAETVGGEDVRITVGDGFNRVVLEVVDDGEPLTEGDPEEVFEPQFTVRTTRSGSQTVGLGLAVARGLARAMGGDLRYFRHGDTNVFELSLRRLAKVVGRRGQLPDIVIDPSEGKPTHDAIEELLVEGGLSVVYQPIVDMTAGSEDQPSVVGYESLSRFPHSSPRDWFRTAGKAGLGLDLELAAIRAGVEGFAAASPHAFVALNLSNPTLISPRLSSVLDGADLGRVVLELSESARIKSYEATRRAVDALRDHGVRLAVDDVGVDEIDLWHILRLDPEIIKIDRRLVADTTQIRRNNALIRALATMAADLGIMVVAEAVETAQERDRLLELGVRFGQGYLFGRPRALQWEGTEDEAPATSGA